MKCENYIVFNSISTSLILMRATPWYMRGTKDSSHSSRPHPHPCPQPSSIQSHPNVRNTRQRVRYPWSHQGPNCWDSSLLPIQRWFNRHCPAVVQWHWVQCPCICAQYDFAGLPGIIPHAQVEWWRGLDSNPNGQGGRSVMLLLAAIILLQTSSEQCKCEVPLGDDGDCR